MDKSRRAVLKKGGIVASTVMIAGCSGQSNEGEGNGSNNDDGTGTNQADGGSSKDQNDGPSMADIDITHSEFAEMAFIYPEYIREDVIGDNDEFLNNYQKALGMKSWSIQSSLESLDASSARYLIDNSANFHPISVFNEDPFDKRVDLSDVGFIGYDLGDNTSSAVLDLSLSEALEGLKERGDITVSDTFDDYVAFESDGHKPEWMENLEYDDSFPLSGHLVNLEDYDATMVSLTLGNNTHPDADPILPIVEDQGDVEDIADFHFALIEGDRYSIFKAGNQYGPAVEHVLNRADGEGDQPNSEYVAIGLSEENPEQILSAVHQTYQDERIESRKYSVKSNGDRFESVEREDERDLYSLEELVKVRDE